MGDEETVGGGGGGFDKKHANGGVLKDFSLWEKGGGQQAPAFTDNCLKDGEASARRGRPAASKDCPTRFSGKPCSQPKS